MRRQEDQEAVRAQIRAECAQGREGSGDLPKAVRECDYQGLVAQQRVYEGFERHHCPGIIIELLSSKRGRMSHCNL